MYGGLMLPYGKQLMAQVWKKPIHAWIISFGKANSNGETALFNVLLLWWITLQSL